jgi:UDP-N-acetylglucosamine 2-epimerase
MYDATLSFAPIAKQRSRVLERLALRPGPYSVLTLHREANTDPDRLRRIISELNALGWTFVFPVHPRTRRVLDEHSIQPAPYLHAIEPLGYLDMLALVSGSSHVVTDSGGLQKEAYWLGVPCVTVRGSTEWVETVQAGANILVDPSSRDSMYGVGRALTEAAFPKNAPQLYGDGHAAARIAETLVTLPL